MLALKILLGELLNESLVLDTPTVSLARSRYRWPDDHMVPLGTAYFAGYMLEALCQCGLFAEAQSFIEHCWELIGPIIFSLSMCQRAFAF